MTPAVPPLLLRRLSPPQLLLLDAVLAAGIALLCWYAASEAPAPPATGPDEPVWLSALVGAALGLPVAARRHRPLTMTGVVVTVAVIALTTGVIPDYAVAAPVLAMSVVLYTVGADVPGRRSLAVLGAAIAANALALLFTADSAFGPGTAGVGFSVLMLGAGWAIGWTVRERRAYAARAVEQLTERAVNDERLRIAREMHDIVAHSMSLIAVKASIANHVADERPQEVRDALRVIEATSRGAMAELRRALRTSSSGPASSWSASAPGLAPEADLAPAPGVADLPALVSSFGAAVSLDVRGDTELPEGVGLSVFRIVQESLTNVVKHAGPARCRVEVISRPDEVRIAVSDDGRRWPAPAAGGHGLIGMRERVALYGGEFTAGPRDGGGFAVHAVLPYGRRP